MKRITIVLMIISLFFGFVQAQTPDENAEKYEFYRQRLKNDFIYFTGDGHVKGSHIPMEARRENSNKKVGYWADAIWWQGHYVAVLATEYRLLQLRGRNTDSTLQELKAALDVYDRLDWEAELCWQGDSALNGFYLRDDVDQTIAPKINIDVVSSDYLNHCGKSETSGNAPSQDQAWGTYLGFALAKKLVDDTTVHRQIEDITTRIIKGMQYTDANGKQEWQIMNPVTGGMIQTKGDIQWLKFAHASVGEILTDNTLHFDKSDKSLWKTIWNVLQNNLLIDKNGHFTWYGVMALSTVINEWGSGEDNCYDWLIKTNAKIVAKRPDLEQSLFFPHLPLANVVLYGYSGTNPLGKAPYLLYLDAAPKEGACHTDTVQSPAPWHSLSIFCPWHTKDVGEFNMLDYMLLYNLYELIYDMHLPEYEIFWRENE